VWGIKISNQVGRKQKYFLGNIIDSGGARVALHDFPRENVVILKPKVASVIPSHLSKRGQNKYIYRGHH